MPLPRLPSHRMSAPTTDDARTALTSLTGEDVDALWAEVCAEAGVPEGAYLLDLDQMTALADAVAARPGAVGLAGRALAIRVATYRALSTHETTALPTDWARRSMESLLRGRVPDTARMAEILDLDLFSDAARARLDRAARRVAERFGAPIGLVSIVLEGSQQFAGSHGLEGWLAEVGGTPLEWSFCATSVRTREAYIVPDAHSDVIQRTNPLVDQDGVRTYAGVPLVTSRGQVLGNYCLIGSEARSWTAEETAELQAMADALVAELERTRVSGRTTV